jgi:hypothetical protein
MLAAGRFSGLCRISRYCRPFEIIGHADYCRIPYERLRRKETPNIYSTVREDSCHSQLPVPGRQKSGQWDGWIAVTQPSLISIQGLVSLGGETFKVQLVH